MLLPTPAIDAAVTELSKLPGIGKKTALRMVIYLLKQQPDRTEKIAAALLAMIANTRPCSNCYNVSESPLCTICEQPNRLHNTICVVEHFQDIIAIENTRQYHGVYHVLGGIISPVEGIGPDQLNVSALMKRVGAGDVSEIILALNSSIEGETTMFYLHKRLSEYKIKTSIISRGIAFGSELEFTDELTLGRSIVNRVNFETQLSNH
jgi:recombination protein RecR